MKTILLIALTIFSISIITNHAFAVCAADTLEWWEACNDTGPANALPLNPMLLFVVFPVVIVGSVIGGLVLRIRRKRR